MRVKTKYANGILIGIEIYDNLYFSYKVLLDNEFPSDVLEDDIEFSDIEKTENRIYHCRYITLLADNGIEIKLDELGMKCKI